MTIPVSLTHAIRSALEVRRVLSEDPTQTVYRLFHGYGEGCPGLTIDRYGEVALVSHKVDVAAELPEITDVLLEHYPFERVLAKAHRYFNWDSQAISVSPLVGELPTAPIEVMDNGLKFLATVHTREANGFFLDSRPARRWLLEHSAERRILNLFAYTGSLGVAAMAGGARSVVHVDSKNKPLETARKNHLLNDLPLDSRSFMKGNVYQHLPRAHRAGVCFDGVILDPPPRVPDRMANRQPLGQDYRQLTPLVTPLLAPGAWLLCFFNRFDRCRVDLEQDVLESSEVPLEVLWRGSSGEDFPEDDRERKLRLTAFVRR